MNRVIRKLGIGFVAALGLAAPASSQEPPPPPAEKLLACSIGYHDPSGRWPKGVFKITDVSSKPDGTISRRTVLMADNARGRFDIESRVDGHVIAATILGDSVEKVALDGKTDFSPAEIERFQLSPEGTLRRRNFFLYLLGLPMKLRDPGTRLDPVAKRMDFQGVSAYELRVTYDGTVGTDRWYFYLDPGTCALIGHRFFHDEAVQDGEYTVHSGEVAGQGLKIPRVRKWYTNKDGEWIITHTVESIEAP